MGLCKCPKRKVTNLFCFEHRVNVCEHCLVANHAKCIVQSYLQWLQDSDYSSNCRLCNTPLAARETTRLVCYDLFHWACLNERAAQLPQNTAPAGYQCPSCSGPIFPPSGPPGTRGLILLSPRPPRSRDGSRKQPLTLLQRAGLLLLLGLLGFLALLALMSRLGRAATDNDPNLDPLMNPHIRVGPS
uniref:Zinc finger protein-like 1 n=1 Tax=Molossus molossus TaxID=27622 RepID=A0A7J8EWS4_MOLMO|nr:zinc finger protein like 1 [Molossus molossus]